jgi:predicted phosphohydrolase
MNIWAIADLHLSFGIPNKKMDIFGPAWTDHAQRLQAAWDASVLPEDLVLIPGDISWAMRFEDALPDLNWIHKRPGTKVLIRGNHDYWWSSLSKMRQQLPSSLHLVQNDCYTAGTISICGTRYWESPEYKFDSIINVTPGTMLPQEPIDEGILHRELARLELSLQKMPSTSEIKIAMTHFPPIGLALEPSRASQLFERYGIQLVVFGHLHSFRPNIPALFGTARGVRYVLASLDWLNCCPVQLMKVSLL